MTVRQLNRDQLAELKERMVDDEIYEHEGRGASYGELADAAEDVPDERVFERYEGVEFVPEDFQAQVRVHDARHGDRGVTVRDKKRKESQL